MADAGNTGPSLRDMAYAAAGGGIKSSNNALADAANEALSLYSEQMADAALQREAERKYRKGENKVDKGFKALSEGKENKAARKFRKADKKFDSDEAGLIKNPDGSIEYSLPEPPDPADRSIFRAPESPGKMRSPMKSLYGAAFAAAGGFRDTTKKASGFSDAIAKAAETIRKNTLKVLEKKVEKELQDFSPKVVDLEGFNGFMNGKQAVTNFGIDLKKQIAEQKNIALSLNPYSTRYKETMGKISSLVESTKTLNMEKMRLANLKKEWGTSSKNNLYSKGSSKTTMHYLKQVMSQTAGMELDENGQVVFNVARLDDPTIIEKISFDDLNKDLYLKVELDVGQKINDYHTMIRKNNYDNLGFNKDGNKTFWNTLIAPDEESVSFDGELLSWIHDKPYNMYSNTSFYQDFEKYFKGKPLAIGEDGAPVVMNQKAIDALFDTDTRDWDVELIAGTNANGQPIIKTVRDYIREELVNYYARTSEQYYYYLTQKQDITSSTVGKSIEETNVNTEFSN